MGTEANVAGEGEEKGQEAQEKQEPPKRGRVAGGRDWRPTGSDDELTTLTPPAELGGKRKDKAPPAAHRPDTWQNAAPDAHRRRDWEGITATSRARHGQWMGVDGLAAASLVIVHAQSIITQFPGLEGSSGLHRHACSPPDVGPL